VLDIGCGPGIFADPCVAQGLHYHGVDVSERMIDEARRRFANVNSADFSVSDARRLPLKDNSFDVVLCLGILEYVPKAREIKYLKEIIRVLRPGGTVVFSFLNKKSPYWLLNDYILPTFRLVLWAFKELSKKIGLKPQNDFAAREIFTRKFKFCERINLLRSLGLSATETIHFSPVIIPPRLDKRLPKLTTSMTEKMERALAPNMLQWLGQAFIIVAHKGNDNREAAWAS
jgi:SAM-dependent methyltransferase